MVSNNILEICHLSKFFGPRKVVDNVSFQIKEGSFFALLGSNGAGKTTILNTILSFLKADDGWFIFNGDYIDSFAKVKFFKQEIGVVFQESVLDQELTVMQNLEIAASLYHLSNKEQFKNIQEVINLLKINNFLLNKKVKTLSGGEKRKIDIARAVIHRPKILFLDELTAGLDPEAQNTVWHVFKQLNQQGTTVVFTTHYLEETESADQVLILHQGKIIDLDTVNNLKNKYHLNYIAIHSTLDEKLEVLLIGKKIHFAYKNDGYHVYFENETQLNSYLSELKDFLKDFKIINGSMRDVFLHAVGTEI